MHRIQPNEKRTNAKIAKTTYTANHEVVVVFDIICGQQEQEEVSFCSREKNRANEQIGGEK